MPLNSHVAVNELGYTEASLGEPGVAVDSFCEQFRIIIITKARIPADVPVLKQEEETGVKHVAVYESRKDDENGGGRKDVHSLQLK